MGNDLGKSTNRMAISAMANATQFGKKELKEMLEKFSELAKREGNPFTITRAEFREALELVGITESDSEILERLFTMFDKTGNDQISYREFVVGLAPLCHGTISEKLIFGFELYTNNTNTGDGQIKPQEMEAVLMAINDTASYFGDWVVKREEVSNAVREVFAEVDAGKTGTIAYRDCTDTLIAHHVLQQFVNGQGTVRYGSA